MNLVGEKGQNHRTRLDISGSQLTMIRVPATRLQSQVLMLFEEAIEERDFEQKAVWSKNHGNHMG